MYFLHDLHKKYGMLSSHNHNPHNPSRCIQIAPCLSIIPTQTPTGPIVRVTPGEVSIASPSAAKEIHKFRSEYLKTQFYEDSSFDEAQNVFTTADPVYHAEWRRLYARAVSQGNLINFQPLIQKYVALLIRQIEREKGEQGWVDLVKWFKCFTSDVTGELSVGSGLRALETGEVSCLSCSRQSATHFRNDRRKPLAPDNNVINLTPAHRCVMTQESQYVKDIKRVMPLNILRLALWQGDFAKTRHLPFFPFSALRGVGERLSALAKAYIDDYRARISSGGAGSTKQTILLDKALETQAASGDGAERGCNISEHEITSNAVLLMLAGTDTTANTLAYMHWLLFTYPDVKERLVREIDDAGMPAQPGIEDLARLKYLECFMLEAMRLYGAAPGPLPRKVVSPLFSPLPSPVAWLLQYERL